MTEKTQPQRRSISNAVRGLLHRGERSTPPPAAAGPRPRRSVRDLITEKFGDHAYDKTTSPSTQMAQPLAMKPVYQGTVDKAVIARRRATNKRARVARRVHRRASR